MTRLIRFSVQKSLHLSLQISKIHSLSRILFQLLYILLLVRSFLIHLERERERERERGI